MKYKYKIDYCGYYGDPISNIIYHAQDINYAWSCYWFQNGLRGDLAHIKKMVVMKQ